MTSEQIRKLLNEPEPPGLQYIAQPKDYINEVINGYKMDILKYGFGLDEYQPFKCGQLSVVVGHTTVGKTTVLLWLLSKIARQGKKILIYSAENRISSIAKNLVRFQLGKPTFTKDEVMSVVPNYHFIKHERQFSYKDILQQATYVLDAGFDMDCILIDPYNALKVEKDSHQYHYDAAEELRVFTMSTNKNIILNCHTNTEAQRVKPDADGMSPVPLPSFVEGGVKFINKPDDVMVIHRQIHAKDFQQRFVTELYVSKVRNMEYGGKLTRWDQPIKIRYRQDHTGFDEEGTYEEKFNTSRNYFERQDTEALPF